MKKKILSLLLAVIMIISIMPMCFAEETMALEEKVTTAGLGNFKKTNIYSAGMFQDFLSSDWFASNVINAYELGLVKGTTAKGFAPFSRQVLNIKTPNKLTKNIILNTLPIIEPSL